MYIISKVTLFGGGIGLNQCSCSTLGPVSTWIGDRLWAGKPPLFVTSRLGQLSLLSSAGGK